MNFTKTTFFTFCLVFLVAACGYYKFTPITQNVPDNIAQSLNNKHQLVDTDSTDVDFFSMESTPVLNEIDLEAFDNASEMLEPKETIVIDPGHGGYDPGKVGTSKNYEKDINLKIALKLKTFLEEHKYNTVLTRLEDKDLDSYPDKFHKKEDMHARSKIINEFPAAALVSIHQNAFAQEKVKGAQVFYYNDQSPGKMLASFVKDSIKEHADPDNSRPIKASQEYYLLKTSKIPGIIVECGFLTNKEEEKKLLSDEYQTKMAQAIGFGIIKFLESTSTTS